MKATKTFEELLKSRRELSRVMMAEAEAALTPIVEKYRAHADPRVLEQMEEGLITRMEVINHIFDELNPFPIPEGEPPTLRDVREALSSSTADPVSQDDDESEFNCKWCGEYSH
jgi:hypothetical protein